MPLTCSSSKAMAVDTKNAGSPPVDLDLVFLWVNASDETWQARRREAVRQQVVERGDRKLEKRLSGWSPPNDYGELRYSLRSVWRHAPWIRRVWIITTNQSIAWLESAHPNVSIVDGDALMRRVGGATPTFSNHALYLASAPHGLEIELETRHTPSVTAAAADSRRC